MVRFFKHSAGFLRPQRVLMAVLLSTGAAVGGAQAQSLEVPRNVVHLSASGQVEVDQDWLQMRLAANHEGATAAAVQQQLQQSLDAALRAIQPQVQGQQLQVRSGSFGVYPRHGADSKIRGWQGRAELILEGRDFARITQAAAQAPGMVIADLSFGLSKEGAAQVQAQATAKAVAQFKVNAQMLAQEWGFGSYTLRELHVNYQDASFAPRMYAAAMPASAERSDRAEPVSVQAGKAQVSVQITGAVQMQ